MRYLPLALAEYAMQVASRNRRLTASGVLASGRGAPARTAIPTDDFAISVRLSAIT